MVKKVFHLTAHGKRELEDELQRLTDSRGAIAMKIAEARSFGDLSENADYSTARDDQARTESRISEIERILANCDIIADDGVKNGVGLGDFVVLKNGAREVEYELVGAVEADPLNGKISDESALGKQLIGHKIGDKIIVTMPKGNKEYSILEIK